jgi:thiol-disulfide isomerase/thioredoxin
MVNTLILYLLFGAFSYTEMTDNEFSILPDSMTLQVMDYDQLKPLLNQKNDTTYVVNFWATWCAPCVKEIPYFVQLDSLYADAPFKLVLVSLDFKKDYIQKLMPFVRDRNLEDYVVVLEDNRSNFWIDDIDKSWSGAIPATLVFQGERRTFYEKSFHHMDELNEIIKPFLKN